MILSAALFTMALILCTACSWYCYRRACRYLAAGDNASTQLIDSTLALIQLLQKHRGLGAQQKDVAATQRMQIAREIDQRWRSWVSDTQDMSYLQGQWLQLKIKPTDFDGHSRLIKDLLGFIEILALRVNGPALDLRVSFVERCRALEDLAKLRGLSVRAANYPQCPIELKVTLKYLCQNLQSAKLNDNALSSALNEINRYMLDAHHTTISSSRCFEILTPIIDNALNELRQSTRSLRQPDRRPSLDLAPIIFSPKTFQWPAQTQS